MLQMEGTAHKGCPINNRPASDAPIDDKLDFIVKGISAVMCHACRTQPLNPKIVKPIDFEIANIPYIDDPENDDISYYFYEGNIIKEDEDGDFMIFGDETGDLQEDHGGIFGTLEDMIEYIDSNGGGPVIEDAHTLISDEDKGRILDGLTEYMTMAVKAWGETYLMLTDSDDEDVQSLAMMLAAICEKPINWK